MSRYIDADEYEKRIKPYDTEDKMDKALYNFAHNILICCPTADVKPIVYGEWININGIKTCNQCGIGLSGPYDYFCPNCGARMKGDNQ